MGVGMNVSDIKAIITGGSSGLGGACVRHIAELGGKAAIFDIEKNRGEALAKEIGANVTFVETDVTSEDRVKASIATATDFFGEINVVINCAGIGDASKVYSKSRGPFNLSLFSKIIQVNLIGTFNVIRLAVESMIDNEPDEEGERGVIINTASVAAFEGQIGQAAYSASKGGIVSMMLPIARECASYGIRVMTIAPGIFDTPMLSLLPDDVRKSLEAMTPFPKRLGKPSEYAETALHIIGNKMLNGDVIRIDGAMRMQ